MDLKSSKTLFLPYAYSPHNTDAKMDPKEVIDLALKVVENQERWRGSETINLIASENVMSPLARSVLTSDFWHRYAEGTIGYRFYEGTKFVDEVEQVCVNLFKELYHANYADVRPISGAVANMAVFYAFSRPGDKVMSLSVPTGAHISYTEFGSAGYRGLNVIHIPFDEKEMNIDTEKLASVAKEVKPSLFMLGGSIILFPVPLREVREIAEEVGSIVCYDAAHVMGLIAGGLFNRPFEEGAHVVSGSTHKTLPGPQGGVVLTNDEEMFKQLKKAIFPGLVSNHHLHRLPALAIMLAEMKLFGKEYAEQIVKNAKALGKALYESGFDVLCAHKGFTESHQVVVDVSKLGRGDVVAKTLEKGNIIVNKNLLPWDDVRIAENPSGIRLGVQEMTRRGMKEEDMEKIAEFMARLIIRKEDPEKVRENVISFRKLFPKIHYCFQ